MTLSAPGNLPDDLIIAIAISLKHVGYGTADLLNFILVCTRWRELGLPIFYSNITLANTTLLKFVNSFDRSSQNRSRYVRSLTVRLEPNVNTSYQTFFGTTSPPAEMMVSDLFPPPVLIPQDFKPEMLAQLTPTLRYFTNVASVSLTVTPPIHSILRSVLIELLQCLPETCVNLELDTQGEDHRNEDEEAHICPVIRMMLPRMHSLRIRVGAMCSAMFSTHSSKTDFVATQTPHLRSLLVHCGSGAQIQRCGAMDYTTSAKHPSSQNALAYPSILEGLTHLVAQQDLPDSAIIRVVVGSLSDPRQGICLTNFTVDVRNKTTWAIPHMHFAFDQKTVFLTRLPDDSEQVLPSADLGPIAEGYVWTDSACGARLPTQELEKERRGLPTFATGCVEVKPAKITAKEWVERHPRVALNSTYRNEESAGQRLMIAEKRTGAKYAEERPVKEITPEGWVRDSEDHMLRRISFFDFQHQNHTG